MGDRSARKFKVVLLGEGACMGCMYVRVLLPSLRAVE